MQFRDAAEDDATEPAGIFGSRSSSHPAGSFNEISRQEDSDMKHSKRDSRRSAEWLAIKRRIQIMIGKNRRNTPLAVMLNDIEYPSTYRAGKEENVNQPSICSAFWNGRTSLAGKNLRHPDPEVESLRLKLRGEIIEKIQVLVDGVEFPTMSAGARSIGCGVGKFSNSIKRGMTEIMGHAVSLADPIKEKERIELARVRAKESEPRNLDDLKYRNGIGVVIDGKTSVRTFEEAAEILGCSRQNVHSSFWTGRPICSGRRIAHPNPAIECERLNLAK